LIVERDIDEIMLGPPRVDQTFNASGEGRGRKKK
jgi:hypothetical protein